LNEILADKEYADSIITSSTEILSAFLYMWGAVAGAYALGRTAEKRGISNTVTQLATGNKTPSADEMAKSIEDKVKEKIKW